jgi:Tol biopolymer transport system component
MKRILLLTLLGLMFPLIAGGQGLHFGKNKVQYTNFNWQYIQSDHFDVYFYDGGFELAQFTALAAEEAYVSIRRTFRYRLTDRIPIIVYISHNDFQQTNVVAPYMEEGIGGVTELFKNRIVMPFRGDYSQYRHVLHHELVHAVVNDMFYGGSIQSVISNNIQLQIPLWFNEGLAEYEALGWETESDMFMRDATVNEFLPRRIPQLGGYMAYRGGQSVFHFIAERYGRERIGDILHRIKSTRSVEYGFRSAIGIGLEELSEQWFYAQREEYWPSVGKYRRPVDFAQRLTNHREDNSFMNNSPAISPQGDKIAFISDRRDYYNIYLMSAIDGRILRRVIRGYSTTDFEQLHLLTPALSWSPNGDRLAFAAKSRGKDVIYIVPVERARRERLSFDLDAIFSVKWSPDGGRLAFIGTKERAINLYIYDLDTQEMTALTDDMFTESEPAWSPDGETIYFVSNRGGYTSPREETINDAFAMMRHDFDQVDLYAIHIGTGDITRLTDSWDAKKSPVVTPDGDKLMYISDKNGIYNLYVRDLESGRERPLTNSLNPILQISLTADASKLAFSTQFHGGYDIFVMNNPLERKLDREELERTNFIAQKVGRMESATAAVRTDTLTEPDTSAAEPAAADTLFAEGADTLFAERADTAVTAEADTTGESSVYGDDILLDLDTYVFGDHITTPVTVDQSLIEAFNVRDNVDDDGTFIPKDYRINFSPDIVLANAGYSTFWGVQGSTLMAFSDMLGDHQLYFMTNLQIDLKNSDYGLAYLYLPGRIDWAFQGFHTARFLFQSDRGSPFGGYSLFRYRTYGAGVMMSRPIDRFRRFDVSLSWFNLSRENLDNFTAPIQRHMVLFPAVSYVHDNVLWGYISPRRGSRYNLTVHGAPKLGGNSFGFMSVIGDYRTYTTLGGYYTFALRLTGGSSFGPDPQPFMLGGVEGWINRRFENNIIPIEDAQDFAFLTPVLPLRGHNYNAKLGSNFALMNFEMRYPLIRYFVGGPLPLALQNIMGVTFLDIGSAWNDFSEWRGVRRNEFGNLETEDLLIGTGFGARFVLFGLLLRFDMAWSYDLDSWSRPKYYWSIAMDF